MESHYEDARAYAADEPPPPPLFPSHGHKSEPRNKLGTDKTGRGKKNRIKKRRAKKGYR